MFDIETGDYAFDEWYKELLKISPLILSSEDALNDWYEYFIAGLSPEEALEEANYGL